MIEGINHVTLTVVDLEEAFNFYIEVLQFKALAKRKNRSAYLLAGENWIALVLDKNKKKRELTDSYAHLAFSVSPSHFKSMVNRIWQSGAIIWQENSSPGESLYFLDPSGNRLEIHVGDWKTRIRWLKEHPSPEVEIFI